MSKRSEPENYFAILGVARTASFEEIRAAFRARAKALHPDKNQHRDTKEDFQRIQEAYAFLSRPRQRGRPDFSEPPARAPAAEPAPRRWRKYGFAGLAISVLGLALIWYRFYGPATREAPGLAELDKEMEAAFYRHALTLYGPEPEPAEVEVVGKDGRRYLISRVDSKRLGSIYDRLVTESKELKQRKEDLDARRTGLDGEQRALSPSDVGSAIDFSLKVDVFNRDGAALRRDFELHTGEVEDYFRQIERLAVGQP